MRAVTAVNGYCRPLHAQTLCCRASVVPHPFDRPPHACGQLGALAFVSEVRNLRRFVQLRPDPVSDELTNYAEARGLNVLLDRRTNGHDRVTDARLLDSLVQ